jgi:hypothetical protein
MIAWLTPLYMPDHQPNPAKLLMGYIYFIELSRETRKELLAE